MTLVSKIIDVLFQVILWASVMVFWIQNRHGDAGIVLGILLFLQLNEIRKAMN